LVRNTPLRNYKSDAFKTLKLFDEIKHSKNWFDSAQFDKLYENCIEIKVENLKNEYADDYKELAWKLDTLARLGREKTFEEFIKITNFNGVEIFTKEEQQKLIKEYINNKKSIKWPI
jgi:hypothetical protein